MTDRDDRSPETDVVQAMHFIDPATGAVTPPVQPSTTFARDEGYSLINPAHSYGRDQSPAFRLPERMLMRMEEGADAMLFGSGMAAGAAVIQSLSPGDRVVAPRVMYWGLRNWMVDFCRRWNVELVHFDASDPRSLEATVTAGPTALVWIETPCNPTWDVIDIEAAASVAHDAGALLAVDSTVATPVLTRPLALGADIVMHSATKYLNGHSDVIAGALVTAREDDLWERLRHIRAEGGAILGPFEAWLLQRGMRTAYLRVRRASESAMTIARHFEHHPALRAVSYPGLAAHPGHEIAVRQMSGGFGGMLSFCVGDDDRAALDMVSRCRRFIRATSLGGVESLVEHRYTIEGPSSPIPANLVRLSIGIEPVEELIADLEQALG